jgi:hypothetical protein
MANDYGAFSEKAYPKDNNYGAYQESQKVVFPTTPKKARAKATDHSNMDPLYKPAASPGPIESASNVREGRSSVKGAQPGSANVREGRMSPKSTTPSAANQRESRTSAPSTNRTSRGN